MENFKHNQLLGLDNVDCHQFSLFFLNVSLAQCGVNQVYLIHSIAC